MTIKHALRITVIALLLAIGAVLGIKLAPVLTPPRDLTLPAKPCEPGLPASCSASLPDGGRVELRIAPQPIRPLQPLELKVTVEGLRVDSIEIDLDGVEMKMGYNRPRLNPADAAFVGQAILPVCVSGTMTWSATVLLASERQRLAVPFHFVVAPR